MRNYLFTICFVLFSSICFSQRLHIGIFGGASAYNGDLEERLFPKQVTNGVLGITGNYEITDQIMLRAGLSYTVVGGADRFSKDTALQKRNLAFETELFEFSVTGEYYLLNLYNSRYSPYVFAGVALFHFDPYAFDATGQKVFLQPLSTEGQGLSGYPNKPYKLLQLAIPFGGGVKFAINDNLRVGLELGLRKLFTDYLDDVSGNYADPNDLLAAKGQVAVDMSYRGDEAGGSPTYPAKGAQRGSPKAKDYYYFGGVHLTYRIGNSGSSRGFGRKSKTGCPVNVY
ncbi:MAG: hypothetical protein KDB99_12160 [Chitinophagaceae bacterium]|nr:hypothetical protein [Chitinophagaceae bacterium]